MYVFTETRFNAPLLPTRTSTIIIGFKDLKRLIQQAGIEKYG